MKSLTIGHFKTGVQAVKKVKWRSFLTMLGVIIGVASVITVVSIGQGVKQQINNEINHMGKDVITIRPGGEGQGSGIGLLTTGSPSGALQDKDTQTVASTQNVSVAVPLSIVAGKASGEKADNSALVIGTTEDLPTVLNQRVDYGVFFSSDDYGSNVAVIGSQVASDMFNENVPLGRTVTINGTQFSIRGIFSQFDSAPLSIDTDFNNAIFIPYQTAEDLTNNTSPIYEILAKPTAPNLADSVASSIERNLQTSHGGQKNFRVLRQEESSRSASNILNLLTALVGGVAAISLIVGGIGIMNVMLVSVTERMHEIGIRKAIGATNRQVLGQFVVESTVLSLAGGLIGVVLAFVADIALRLFTSLEPVINWQIVLVAVFVSVAVGVIFGSVPALKAARKDPIEALRNE